MRGKRCTGDDVDVVSGSKAARRLLSDELLAETVGANPFTVGFAVRNHLDTRHPALCIEERREIDVLMLTDFTIEECVSVDMVARVRDVEDVLSLFELLARSASRAPRDPFRKAGYAGSRPSSDWRNCSARRPRTL